MSDNKFSGCPHCGRTLADETNKDGFSHKIIGKTLMHQIACPCGIMTKLCVHAGQLRIIWNSRRNKPWIEPAISVKHPGPRGAEPTTLAGTQDAF